MKTIRKEFSEVNLINEFVQVRNDLADFIQVSRKRLPWKITRISSTNVNILARRNIRYSRVYILSRAATVSRVFRIRTRFARRPSTSPLLARFFIYFLMLNSWLGSDGCSLRSRWNSRAECVPRVRQVPLAICVECTSFLAQASRKRYAKIVPSCSRRREMMDIFRDGRLSRQCFKRVTSQGILYAAFLSLFPSLSLYFSI